MRMNGFAWLRDRIQLDKLSNTVHGMTCIGTWIRPRPVFYEDGEVPTTNNVATSIIYWHLFKQKRRDDQGHFCRIHKKEIQIEMEC